MTPQIGFIVFTGLYCMDNADGLDRWIEDDTKSSSKFSKSLFPHERITLYSLKERIAELERMRDQILYEIDKLKALKADF